ncbi:MAG: helix-turn-helix transcriptional regulator [Nitrospinae bacterium]|nr:helix-turn-helix transcriptional regulator [Nitrospinota bacterium]
MTTGLIGKRIRALREERKLSQENVAGIFGFKDRQTVSAIETGVRRVTAEELLLAVERLGASLEYFTDPFLLSGEGHFSWRQSGVDAERLGACERSAGRWIAAFRTLAPEVGYETPLMRRSLGLTRRSSYEDAMSAGERFATEFELGETPAVRLADVMERELGILVLMVEAERGVSGAACRLPDAP